MRNPRVAIADSGLFTGHMLGVVLTQYGIEVVGESAGLAELPAVCAALRPDVALVNILHEEDAVPPAVTQILATGTRVVVLSDDRSPERITALLAAGVSGYLLYDTSLEQVVDALRAVMNGAAALHPAAARTVLEQWRRFRTNESGVPAVIGRLTARESEVLAGMADGLSTKAIARRLGVAVKTVENHKIRVFDKLGVHTHAQAVSLAIGLGLLAPRPGRDVDDIDGADVVDIAIEAVVRDGTAIVDPVVTA